MVNFFIAIDTMILIIATVLLGIAHPISFITIGIMCMVYHTEIEKPNKYYAVVSLIRFICCIAGTIFVIFSWKHTSLIYSLYNTFIWIQALYCIFIDEKKSIEEFERLNS